MGAIHGVKATFTALLLALLVTIAASPLAAAPLAEWRGWDRLIGEWTGGSSRGIPGSATSSGFTFRYDLERHVIVRTDWSDYPAAQGRPSVHHEGLMVISPGIGSAPARATYYDNEGHVIQYDYVVGESTIVFTSVPDDTAPAFRLTYRFEKDRLGVEFQIAQPGVGSDYKTYVEGTATRVTAKKSP